MEETLMPKIEEDEEILFTQEIEKGNGKKVVTPIGDFGAQSFPLIEGNIYAITDEEAEKLGNHELKWSTEEYEAEEPVYEEREAERRFEVDDLEKPIYETKKVELPDGNNIERKVLVGYEKKTVTTTRLEKVQVGTKTVTKTRPILIENDPTAENARNANIARISELKKLLANSDYEAIKFAEGEMTASEYAPYKIQRAAWRAEINQLEEALANEA